MYNIHKNFLFKQRRLPFYETMYPFMVQNPKVLNFVSSKMTFPFHFLLGKNFIEFLVIQNLYNTGKD